MTEPNDLPLLLNTLIKQIFLVSDDLDRRLLLNFGLSVARFNLLKHLAQAGRLTPGELCLRLLCDKANVTRLLDGLEGEELVQRSPDPKDKRRLYIALTPTGAQRLDEADAAYLAAARANFSALPPPDSSTLAALLSQLKVVLDERLALGGAQGLELGPRISPETDPQASSAAASHPHRRRAPMSGALVADGGMLTGSNLR